MKYYLKSLFFAVLTGIILVSCNGGQKPERIEDGSTSMHIVKVLEVQQATSYTYLYVEEAKIEYWMAIPKTEVEVGSTVQFDKVMLMKDFTSKDLKRTFDEIYFVESLYDPNAEKKPVTVDEAHQGMKESTVDHTISVEPAEGGGISLKELFENKNKYAGKIVRVRGEVVKINEGILDRTWVHIQDGTGNGTSNYDLTVTTLDEVWVGSVFTFDGTIALDKDFGAGYVYAIIVEDAKKIQIVKKDL